MNPEFDQQPVQDDAVSLVAQVLDDYWASVDAGDHWHDLPERIIAALEHAGWLIRTTDGQLVEQAKMNGFAEAAEVRYEQEQPIVQETFCSSCGPLDLPGMHLPGCHRLQ